MLEIKKNILICIDWYLPAYKAGGPIQSVANIINHLKNEFNFWIFTSNKDLNEELIFSEPSLNKWLDKDSFKIIYTNSLNMRIKSLNNLFSKYHFDTVYLNSLFSFNFKLIPLIISKRHQTKIVLAPRGMLGAGALAIKPLKKWIYIRLFKLFGLHKNILFHATDISEKDEIRLHFGDKTNVTIAPNLSRKVNWKIPKKNKEKNKLNLFFISRIALKKNLLEAIDIIGKTDNINKIKFTIIGPIDETEYWQECQLKIKNLPQNISVNYLGSVPHQKLNNILTNQHVLFLPTKHENFGHVILESWQMGCPVIISKNTPWKDLATKKIGFDIDNNDIYEYVKVINDFAEMNQDNFDDLIANSYNFGKEFSENKEIVNKIKEIFN